MVDVFFGGLMELKAIQLRLSAICFSDCKIKRDLPVS